LEENHCWFQSRRSLIRSLVAQVQPDRLGAILEVGTSGGVLIKDLQQAGYMSIVGIDQSDEAVQRCKDRGVNTVQVMDGQRLSFCDEAFDVVIASDVLEHMSEDREAAREWWRVLKCDGHAIIGVPACGFLWSEHDEVNMHVRRYGSVHLQEVLRSAGFTIKYITHWNAILFFPILAYRKVKSFLVRRRLQESSQCGDLFELPAAVNRILLSVLRIENWLIDHGVNLPFGVSIIVVVRKDVAGTGGCGGAQSAQAIQGNCSPDDAETLEIALQKEFGQ